MFYVHPTDTFASEGSTCNTNGENGISTCKYLEAAIANGTTLSTWKPGTTATPGTTAQWGCYDTEVMNAAQRTASLEIGTGRANTMKITERICKGTDDSTSAASIAATYNGGGKTDWFLPSRKELDALCFAFFNGRTGVKNSKDKCMGSGNTNAVSGTTNELSWSFAADSYWSSSEGYATIAWYQNFFYGNQGNASKGLAGYVRPVRAF